MTAECVQAMHDYYPRSWSHSVTFTRVFCTSSTTTRSVLAPSVQPACKPWRSRGGCGPPLLPPPSQCICSFVLPPACQSHSCQPSPASGRTRRNCVHATAKANVYMAQVLIRLRSEWCTRTEGCSFPDLCGGRVEKL